jgi:hypothetical protein
MEKFSFVLVIAFLGIMLSCNPDNREGAGSAQGKDSATQASANDSNLAGDEGGGTDSFCTFIPKDTANKMINSYLASINYPGNDSDLRSVIIDVKTLNEYLKATSSTGAKAYKVKLMFAHTLSYINNGGGNQNCGYQSGKLTLVIATYDSAGNYIYMNGTSVLEHLQPCPSYCPVSGSASNNTLQ